MDAQPPIIDVDPAEAMLAELAGLDLTLARHVHACAMATTETEEVTDLSRAYQRIARSLRQSLALFTRLKREREQGLRTYPAPAPAPSGPPKPPRDEARIAERRRTVEAAGRRVIWNEYEPGDGEGFDEGEFLSDLLRDRLDKAVRDDAFGLVEAGGTWVPEPLDDHVARVCTDMDLPEATARAWRDLPDPDGQDPGDDTS